MGGPVKLRSRDDIGTQRRHVQRGIIRRSLPRAHAHSLQSTLELGNAPLQEYSDILFTVLIPHNVTISSSGHFSFSGDVKVSAYEDQTPYPITTHFSISGQFTRGKIKPLKTIAVRGTVTSDYCTAKTPTAFKLTYDKG